MYLWVGGLKVNCVFEERELFTVISLDKYFVLKVFLQSLTGADILKVFMS